MINDRVIWFACIVLITAGFISGVAANSQSLDNWSKAFGVVSGLGTLMTAFVAVVALTTWKEQAKYSERIDAAKKFRLTALEIVSITYSIKILYTEIYSINNKEKKEPKDYSDLDALNMVLKERESEFMNHRSNYAKDYEFLTAFLSGEHFSEFRDKYEFPYFDNRIYAVFGKIRNLEHTSDLVKRNIEIHEIDKAIIKIKNEVVSDFEKLVNH